MPCNCYGETEFFKVYVRVCVHLSLSLSYFSLQRYFLSIREILESKKKHQ